jgi:hypothetical protein
VSLAFRRGGGGGVTDMTIAFWRSVRRDIDVSVAFWQSVRRDGDTREKQGGPKKCEIEDIHDQSPLVLPAGVIPREAFHHSRGLVPLLLRRLGGVAVYSPAVQIFRGLFHVAVPHRQERKLIRIVF